ncbi:hypothetical protein BDFB_013689, partial [Asbolus verrucosus]
NGRKKFQDGWTLSSICSFWPDFPISKEDFLKATPEFVFRFYSNFVTEVNEKFAFLTNEELVEEPDKNPEFDKECHLYRQTLKQQCLQDCAENSENIARGKETNEILKTKLATATKRHEKMLKDKDKIYAKKTAELSKLRTENYNLDYQLNYLSEKESSLEQRLVTEEEFENLKTAKQFLEQELKQLSNRPVLFLIFQH